MNRKQTHLKFLLETKHMPGARGHVDRTDKGEREEGSYGDLVSQVGEACASGDRLRGLWGVGALPCWHCATAGP